MQPLISFQCFYFKFLQAGTWALPQCWGSSHRDNIFAWVSWTGLCIGPSPICTFICWLSENFHLLVGFLWQQSTVRGKQVCAPGGRCSKFLLMAGSAQNFCSGWAVLKISAQGGQCSNIVPDFSYHNSFLIADCKEVRLLIRIFF